MGNLLKLENEIYNNIKLREEYEFRRLEPNFIYFNNRKEESFYIVVCDKEHDTELYTGITPKVQSSIPRYVFLQHGILNGKKIIDTINNHFGINIKYE